MTERLITAYDAAEQRAAQQFAYQATQDKGRRQAPKARGPQPEGELLKPSERRRLTETALDQQRNLSIVAWLIRRHLDAVSRFYPQCRSSDKALNELVEKLFAWHGRPENFDTGKRFSRSESLRLLETTKVVQGDGAWLFGKDGTVQGIEGDRIALPEGGRSVPQQWRKRIEPDGLVIDKTTGAVTDYSICRREGTRLVFGQVVKADYVAFDGYWHRYDMRRGVSPLASAINAFQDLAESQEWTVLKVKLHALLALAFSSDPNVAPSASPFLTKATAGMSTDASGIPRAPAPQRQIEMKNGVAMLDLPAGKQVKTIESQTPASNFMPFEELLIRIALLALDIPYTFFDARGANFSAVIADRQLYIDSVAWKQEKNQAVLRRYGRWKLAYWYLSNPELRGLCDAAGISLLELFDLMDWMPAGQPWLDKLKEVNGDVLAISQGLDSRQRACRRRGQDFYEIMDELADEQRYAEEKGVTLAIGQPGQANVGNNQGGSDAGTTDQQQ